MNLWSVCSPQSVHEVFASFDQSPAPPHHFNPSEEEVENVTSIVLRLGRSNLESPFDGLLPYQDWPLVSWTYAHQLCLLKYPNIMSWLHSPGECEGCSVPPACFFPLPASLNTHSTQCDGRSMFLPPPSLPEHVFWFFQCTYCPEYSFQKTHQMSPILPCFTQCDDHSVEFSDSPAPPILCDASDVKVTVCGVHILV